MLTEKIKSTLKDAAKKLTGFKQRAFMAQVTIDYFNSSPRKAETKLGWPRKAIAVGLKELETGIVCVDNYQARGRKKTEEILPNLENQGKHTPQKFISLDDFKEILKDKIDNKKGKIPYESFLNKHRRSINELTTPDIKTFTDLVKKLKQFEYLRKKEDSLVGFNNKIDGKSRKEQNKKIQKYNEIINYKELPVLTTQQVKTVYEVLTGDRLKNFQKFAKEKYEYEYEFVMPLSRLDFEDSHNDSNDDSNDNKDSKPLSRLRIKEDKYQVFQEIDNWYKKIVNNNLKTETPQSPLLGIVCSGGFLQGDGNNEFEIKDNPFILSLHSGINIFIGQRGSGKSTILDLLSMLLDACRKNPTKSENNTILELINPEKQNFDTKGNGRINYILNSYGITKYACYFYSKNYSHLYAFYVNTQEKYWCFFEKTDNTWQDNMNDPIQFFPEMLVLRQGDVFRIADRARSEKHLIGNEILESLNSELKEHRNELAHRIKPLIDDFQRYKEKQEEEQTRRNYNSTDRGKNREDDEDNKIFKMNSDLINAAEKFIRDSREELNKSKNYSKDSSKIEDFLITLNKNIEPYITENVQLKRRTNISLLKSIKQRHDGLQDLYIGLIADFLREKIIIIQHAINNERSVPFEIINHVIDILEKRINLVEQLKKNLENFESWDEVKDICEKARSFLENQSNFIKNQTKYSEKISKKLHNIKTQNSEIQRISFSITRSQNKELSQKLLKKIKNDPLLSSFNQRKKKNHDDFLSSLQKNQRLHNALTRNVNKFKTKKINEDLTTLLFILKKYNLLVSTTKNFLQELEDCLKSEKALMKDDNNLMSQDYQNIEKLKKVRDCPIKIKIQQKQGEDSLVDFSKLSYGQKSAIILSILLTMTKAELIITDQPEDNLDREAVSDILAPTLSEISQKQDKKIIFLATHNRKLVTGIQGKDTEAYAYFMKEPSNVGGLDQCINLYQTKIVVPLLFGEFEGNREWELEEDTYWDYIPPVEEKERDKLNVQWSYNSFISGLSTKIISRQILIEALSHDIGNLNSGIENQVDNKKNDQNSELIFVKKSEIEEHKVINQQTAKLIQIYQPLGGKFKCDNFNLYDTLKDVQQFCQKKNDNCEILFDNSLKDIEVEADDNYIWIVFYNLIKNSKAAIKTKRNKINACITSKILSPTILKNYKGKIEFELVPNLQNKTEKIVIRMKDNGIGFTDEEKETIYTAQWKNNEDDKQRRGNEIIRSFLDYNPSGNIEIEKTIRLNRNDLSTIDNSGTIHKITLKKAT